MDLPAQPEPATVLVIDDDPSVRLVLRRMLEKAGLRIMQADNGFHGLDAFRASPPDLVLCDLRMPGMDGLDVLRALVAESPETPVIVSSGAGTMDDAVEALRRGAWDYITKPVTEMRLLVHAVERAIEKARLRKQNNDYRQNLEHTNRALSEALLELRADQQGARLLQFQLLPRDGLALGGYTAWRRLYPSQLLSGDFVDYFPLGARHAGAYVADVSGHGAASAFITAILGTLVAKFRQAHAASGDATVLNPGELLARLDRDLAALGLPKHVTMFYAVLDLEDERLSFANAGLFPFPLLWDGASASELESPGRPLGLPGKAGFSVGERAFPRQARLLGVTDGVLELGPDRPHREKRDDLRRLLARCHDLPAIAETLGLREGVSLRDDVGLLLVTGSDPHG